MTERSDFWSRRKARVAEETAAEVEAVEAAKLAEDYAALEEKSDTQILEELGLPDPDTMAKGDDFSAFMAKAVPDRIRRRALRKLWVSNPALANLDGLLDYGEDFTDSAKVIENLQTAYQVGKGMLAHVKELARQAQQDREEGDAEDAAPVLTEAEIPEAPEASEEEATIAFAESVLAEPAEETALFLSDDRVLQDDLDYVPAQRRRMQFSFDEQVGGAT